MITGDLTGDHSGLAVIMHVPEAATCSHAVIMHLL